MTTKIWLVEIDALDGSDVAATLRFSSGQGYQSLPTDTPANAFFEPRIQETFSLERTMFDKSTTYGVNRVGYGRLRLLNNDGGLDYLQDYAFDGREVRMYYGEAGNTSFPSGFTLAVKGKAERMTLDRESVVIELLDKLADLEYPICTAKYLGNNSAPNGVEGSASLKDTRKPRIYGEVSNVTPIFVNTSKLIYQISDKTSTVNAVYDYGATLTAGAAYTSQNDMETNAPAASQYRVWASSSGTYFRLGSTPVGEVTADASTSETRVASLINNVLTDFGISGSDISSSDVTALNTANSSAVGIYCTGEMTVLETVQQLAESIGAYFIVDKTNVYRMGQLTAPSGTEVITFDTDFIDDLRLISTGSDDRGLPAGRVNLEFDKNYTIQQKVAGGSWSRTEYTQLEYRTTYVEDSATLTRHKLAAELNQRTLLRLRTNVDTEASRRLTLYKTKRYIYEFTTSVLTESEFATLDLNAVVKIEYPRFGLDSGVKFRIISITPNPIAGTVKLRVWG